MSAYDVVFGNVYVTEVTVDNTNNNPNPFNAHQTINTNTHSHTSNSISIHDSSKCTSFNQATTNYPTPVDINISAVHQAHNAILTNDLY